METHLGNHYLSHFWKFSPVLLAIAAHDAGNQNLERAYTHYCNSVHYCDMNCSACIWELPAVCQEPESEAELQTSLGTKSREQTQLLYPWFLKKVCPLCGAVGTKSVLHTEPSRKLRHPCSWGLRNEVVIYYLYKWHRHSNVAVYEHNIAADFRNPGYIESRPWSLLPCNFRTVTDSQNYFVSQRQLGGDFQDVGEICRTGRMAQGTSSFCYPMMHILFPIHWLAPAPQSYSVWLPFLLITLSTFQGWVLPLAAAPSKIFFEIHVFR